MNQPNTGYGQPVRSLQTVLRKISSYYSAVPPVIPDGIFGDQTEAAVIGFQVTFKMPVTGIADNDTWNKIIEIYTTILENESEPRDIKIFPLPKTEIYPNDQSKHLFAIQGILTAITKELPHMGQVTVTGIHDPQSVDTIKRLQKISGIEETGIIDRFIWDKAAQIYETFVSRDNIERSSGQR